MFLLLLLEILLDDRALQQLVVLVLFQVFEALGVKLASLF